MAERRRISTRGGSRNPLLSEIPGRLTLPAKICRRASPKQVPAEDNGIFDTQVLSRSHAEISEQGEDVVVRDLQSSNGTFLNGQRLGEEAVILKSGDVLEFGIDVVDELTGTIPPDQAKVSVQVLLPPPSASESLPEVSIGQALPAQPASLASMNALAASLQAQLAMEQDRAVVLSGLVTQLESISAFKSAYILVAKELQVKDDRIADLERALAAAKDQPQSSPVLEETRLNVAKLEASLVESQEKLEEATRAAVQAQKAEAFAKRELATLQSSIEKQKETESQKMAEVEQQVATLTRTLEEVQKELANERSSAKEALVASENEKSKALRSLEARMEELRVKEEEAQKRCGALQQQLSEAAQSADTLKSRNDLIEKLRRQLDEANRALEKAKAKEANSHKEVAQAEPPRKQRETEDLNRILTSLSQTQTVTIRRWKTMFAVATIGVLYSFLFR